MAAVMLPTGSGSPAAEAQRLMALSVNKIVASRSRRGGVSLHRNLLVAGVLFRARDALLAAGKMPCLSQASPPSDSPSSPTEKQQQPQQPEEMTDDGDRKSSGCPPPTANVTDAANSSQQSRTETHSESVTSETRQTRDCEATCNVNSSSMDVDNVGKENVPPPATQSTIPAARQEFTKSAAETETPMACDETLHHQQQQQQQQQHSAAAVRKRRSSECSSSSTCPVAVKSAKTSLSSSAAVPDSKTASSVSVCGSKHAAGVSSKQSSSSSSSSRSSTTSGGSPIVFLNRIDVAFCSASGIGGGVLGSVRPVLVVQVV